MPTLTLTNKNLMGSLDSALTRKTLGKDIVRSVVDDTPIVLRLRYIGSGTVTSVTTTTATNIVNITSDGGTDTYAFATYTTVGALADAINADGIFEAKVCDALRADATASKFVDGAITAGTDANGVVVWDVLADTSATDYMTATLSPTGPDFDAPKGHRVTLKEIVYNVNVNGALANGVQVWRRRGATETQLVRRASVDVTETTIDWANGEGGITGNPDDELIVRVTDSTSITDAAGNFVEASGFLE